jgi:hypothetical protein
MKDVQMHSGKVLFAAAAMWAVSFAFVAPSFGADPAPVDTAKTAERATVAEDAKDTKAAVNQLSKSAAELAKSTAAITPAPAADDIRSALEKTTEAAVSKGGFNDLIKHFVDADRNRLGAYKSSDGFAKLDGRIESFRKDWKSKYGQDFSFPGNGPNVLGDTFGRISQGEIGEAVTAAGKEVPSNEPGLVAGTTDALKKSGVSNTDANSAKVGGGDTNKDVGRNIATVLIPANAGAPELAVPMIHELPDAWRIDVPDNIDGQKLQDNLLKQITLLDEDRANWPADSFDAYRAVARHVMTALMESDTTR